MILPDEGRIMLASILMSVVFPAPFGPSTASVLPEGTSRSMPPSALKLPKDFTSPDISTAGSADCNGLVLFMRIALF
jgi:hypothetical protein